MKKHKFLHPKILLKQRIALIIFGIFLFFTLLEISLRLGGFILLSIQEYRNLQSLKQKGTYRILCLGESTTQGQYPQFLEQALNHRNIGIRFSVIDKGKSGIDTPTILSQIEFYLEEYRPDMVVTMMGINDVGYQVPYQIATSSKTMLIIKSLRTYKLFRLVWLHLLTKSKQIEFYKLNAKKQYVGEMKTYPLGIELRKNHIKTASTEDILKQAVSLNKENDNAYIKLGWFYIGQGKFPQAEVVFKKVIELNPENDTAYLGLGQIYGFQRKFPEAEYSLKKTLGINSKNDDAHYKLLWIYREQGKYTLAKYAFEKAVELNPRNDKAYYELGLLYKEQNNPFQAEKAFKKVIELNPDNDLVYFELGRLYLEQNKLIQAENALKKAIEMYPEDDRAYGLIFVLYSEMGKSGLAKEYVQMVNRMRLGRHNPLTVSSYRKLKKILDKKGIRLVCVQYPMREVELLKKIFDGERGVVFVDNEDIFSVVLRKESYKEYFVDMFAGDFGHCTEKGNRLLAKNIANVILKEVFNR